MSIASPPPATTWAEQEDGSYLATVSDAARKWARGNNEKLAGLSFAAFCRDMQLDVQWDATKWAYVKCALYTIPVYKVHVVADTAYDHDTFATSVIAKPETWYAVVRLLNSRTSVVHILGLTTILDQIQRDPAPHPRHRLLSCREWLNILSAPLGGSMKLTPQVEDVLDEIHDLTVDPESEFYTLATFRHDKANEEIIVMLNAPIAIQLAKRLNRQFDRPVVIATANVSLVIPTD